MNRLSLDSAFSAVRMPWPKRLISVTSALVIAALWSGAVYGAKNDPRIDAARERVHRNRAVASAVAKIAERLQPGCDADTLRLVQLALDYEPDAFNVPESSVRRSGRTVRPQNPTEEPAPLVSLHGSVESQLSKSGQELLGRYESQFGADANVALAEARANQSLPGIRKVARRFFLTAAGYAASEELVIRWLDAGEYELAYQLATQVLAEPAHHDRITPRFREIASQLNVITGISSGAAKLPDRPEAIKFQRQFSRHRESVELFESGWMTVAGNPARNRITQGTAPIPVPLWRTDYFESESKRLIQEYLTEWEGSQKEVDQPLCPAAYPIVVGGQVIFRDSAGVRCVDGADGKTAWSFHCNYNLLSQNRDSNLRQFRRPYPAGSSGNQNQLAANSLMGAISSDGRLVFALDAIPRGHENDADSSEMPGLVRFRNRLLALQVDSASRQGQLVWSNDGAIPPDPAVSTRPENEVVSFRSRSGSPGRLSFLGPPLPGTTELLCVTEQEDEIHLTALVPRTGAVLWSQPLCTLERFEQYDIERHETACIPARSGGIVVCPTNTGLLVAVDQARTKLIWAAYVDDVFDRTLPQSRGGSKPVAYSYSGFPSYCLIANDCVVFLSPRGNQLFCLDLSTGRVLWSIARGDAEYVGGIVDRRILVVGRQGCRCHSLDDGKELWTTVVGSPIGCGLMIGDHYTLPLESGRVASIDVHTGRDEGTAILRSDVSPGHFAADGDRVYSLSQRGLVAFPQVHHAVARLNLPDKVALNERQKDVIRAEVALVLGDTKEAERRLNSALLGELPAADRGRARRDLMELLFQRIAGDTDVLDADRDRLDQLLETPVEQFKFLASIAQPDRKIRGNQSFERLLQRIYRLPADVVTAMPRDDRWQVSPTAWCRMHAANADLSEFGLDAGELARLQERLPAHLAMNDFDEMKRFIRVFDQRPVAESFRMRLASQADAEGEAHYAETLWLRNGRSSNPSTAADAAVCLVDLWERVGFVNDATRQLETLRTKFAQTRLSNGMTGAEYVQHMDRNRLVKQAWRQSRQPTWPVNRVEIRQAPISPKYVPVNPGPVVRKSSVRFFTDRIPMGSQGRQTAVRDQPCEFTVLGGDTGDRQTVSVFDQRTMLLMGAFNAPNDLRWPLSDRSLSGAHFLLLGIRGGALGVSTVQLNESAPVWTQLPADLSGLPSLVTPGPWGPDFASFTWRNHLYVIDPVDGALLWKRVIPVTAKDPTANQRLEVFGDGRALAIQNLERTNQGADRTITYDVFETSTGRKLSTVRPGFSVIGSFGRHVYGLADTPNGRRVQIHDLLKNAPDVDEPLEDPVRPALPPLTGGEIAYIGASEIKVFDVVLGQRKLSVKLDESEVTAVNNFRVMSDSSRYFINLGRQTPTATTRHLNQAIGESTIPSLTVKDDLYAFDKSTGEQLWKRSIPARTILQFPDSQVPFLVTISQVKDSISNAPQSLTIEVLDSNTGATIGYQENLVMDRLLGAQFDGQSGRIKLIGQATDIELCFGPAEGQTLAE